MQSNTIPEETRIDANQLAEGERWAGILLDENGNPSHHLILLPGETEAEWQAAIEWAEQQGGVLPSRKEQALLFANLADEFQRDWYWSSEQHAAHSSNAWCQGFNLGSQHYDRKVNELRARAVRRLSV